MKQHWHHYVAEEMFKMTTCIQSGEERCIPDIWHSVMLERDMLREQLNKIQETKNMDINQARELAAQCWCDPTTSEKEMDVALAEVIARQIEAAYLNGWINAVAFANHSS